MTGTLTRSHKLHDAVVTLTLNASLRMHGKSVENMYDANVCKQIFLMGHRWNSTFRICNQNDYNWGLQNVNIVSVMKTKYRSIFYYSISKARTAPDA